MLTFVLTWPLSASPGSRVLWGGADTELFMWTLAWDAHAFVTNPLGIFDANIFAPEPRTLAYSEHLIGAALFAAPVLWLTGNAVLAMNLSAFATVALCGTGAWLLARRVGLGEAAAMIAGIIFAFSPPRFFRLGQLHLTAVQWIPFGLAYLHAYFDGGRRRDLAVAAAFLTLQAVSSGHGTVFLAVAMAALAAWRWLTREAVPLPRLVKDLGLPGLLILLPVLLVAVPYRAVQDEVGLKRSLVDWTVNAQSYFASPSRVHAWLLDAAGAADINASAGAFLFPGFIPLALAAVGAGLVVRFRTEWLPARPAAFYAALTVVAALFSVGPPVSIWPLVYWLPGFNFIRVPSRFVILALVGIAILAAVTVEWMRQRLPARPRTLAVVALALAIIAEFAVVPLETTPYRFEVPAADRWLAEQPGAFIIAEFPAPGTPGALPAARQQTVYMLHSTAHWKHTIHGYSGIEPAAHTILYSKLRGFPSAESLDALRAAGVRYMVVHPDLYPPGMWEEVEKRLAEYGDRLSIEHVVGRDRVYSLQR